MLLVEVSVSINVLLVKYGGSLQKLTDYLIKRCCSRNKDLFLFSFIPLLTARFI